MSGRRSSRGRTTLLIALGAGALAAGLLLPAGGSARSQTAPANTSLPTISGTAQKGSTLTAGSGSWSGTTPISFAYAWRRCDSAGSNCSAISGATSSTYVLGSSDVGKRIRVQVTASNADGAASALSAATAIVVADAPVNTVEPVISGSAVEGQTLSGTSGSWTGQQPIAFAYQWVRCGADGGKPDGSNCTFVSGATKSTYLLDDDDVGKRMRVRVTATNSAGSKTVASNATGTVLATSQGGPPVNTSEPRISGSAAQGATLSTTSGTWTGATPISFAYRWVRCGADGGKPDGSNCSSISGATSTSYRLTSSDVGRRIRVRVTATNSKGKATVASNATVTVTPPEPSGTITLPNGEKSIPVTSVASDQRLIVDRVDFSPNPVSSRSAQLTIRIKVEDTRGFVVRDALVFVRSTPAVTSPIAVGRTGTDGWITYTTSPQADFPLRNGYSVQFYVKAYRQGDPVLAGVAGTRLVQVATKG